MRPASSNGSGERVEHALGQRGRVGIVGERLAQHGELVAAEPGDGVGRAHDRDEPLRERHEQRVAGVVAERLVDELEAVDAELDDGERAAAALQAGEGLADAVGEEGAAREPGQRVVQRDVGEPALAAAALDREAHDAGDELAAGAAVDAVVGAGGCSAAAGDDRDVGVEPAQRGDRLGPGEHAVRRQLRELALRRRERPVLDDAEAGAERVDQPPPDVRVGLEQQDAGGRGRHTCMIDGAGVLFHPLNRVVVRSARLPEPVLERALDAGVEGVEAVERERLGRAEAAARRGVRPVVAEHAVQQRDAAVGGELGHARLEQLLAEHDVPEQPALVGQPDLGAVGELARLAEVVDDRRGDQQVGVEPRVQLARLGGERATATVCSSRPPR